jgi:hypothetical protein
VIESVLLQLYLQMESMAPTKEQIREQYLANQLFLIGEKVGNLEVIDRRANYIVVVDGRGETSKLFLDEAHAIITEQAEGHTHPHSHDPNCHCVVCRPLERPCGCKSCSRIENARKALDNAGHDDESEEYQNAEAGLRAAYMGLGESTKTPLRFSKFTTKLDEGFAYKGYKPRNFQNHPDAQAVFESLTKTATDPYAVLSALKHVDIFFEKRDEHSLSIARTAVAKIDKIENHPYLSESREDAMMDWHKDAHPILKNEDGTPKTFYHGTALPRFRSKSTAFFRPTNGMGHGAYFTSDPEVASDYAENDVHDEGDRELVLPVHIHMKNPHIMDAKDGDLGGANGGIDHQSINDEIKARLTAAGHDGLVAKHEDGHLEVAVFHPHSIKSVFASKFNPKNKNISEQIKDEEIDFQIEEKLTYSTMAQFLNESFEQHVHQVMDHLEKNPHELDKLADHVKTIEHIAHHYDHHSVHMSEDTEGKAIEHAEPGHRISVRKLSSGPQLVKVAKRAAVELIAQKLANKPIKKISNKEKNEIVKAIKSKKSVVMRLARKLVPKIRHIEHEHQEHTQEFGSAE